MDYTNEEFSVLLQELTNSVRQTNPQDILQFCANFFFSKLSQDRANQYLDQYQHPMAVDSEAAPHPSTISAFISYSTITHSYSGEDDDNDDDEEDESIYDEQQDLFQMTSLILLLMATTLIDYNDEHWSVQNPLAHRLESIALSRPSISNHSTKKAVFKQRFKPIFYSGTWTKCNTMM
ncbi:unnamed protein product [Absidia cylindrospora]